MDIKILMFTNNACIICKTTAFILDGHYQYDLIDVNKSENKNLLKQYKIKGEEDVPTFVIIKDGVEIYRTNAGLSPARIKQLTESPY